MPANSSTSAKYVHNGVPSEHTETRRAHVDSSSPVKSLALHTMHLLGDVSTKLQGCNLRYSLKPIVTSSLLECKFSHPISSERFDLHTSLGPPKDRFVPNILYNNKTEYKSLDTTWHIALKTDINSS